MSRFSPNAEPMGFGSARLTWAVQRLIIANIIVFALQLAADPLLTALNVGPNHFGGRLNPWLGFRPDMFLQGWVWGPITYQFFHVGLTHLLLNMIGLYFFGPDVERVLETRGFFRFYVICGAGGVLATIPPYLLGGVASPVVGASGAVTAVLVAFAMVEPDRQVYLFPFPFAINARTLVLMIFVMNVIYALGGSSVSVATHFGGMGMGFLYMKGLPLVMNYQRKRRLSGKGKKKKNSKSDKVGEAVDNIFKFDEHNRR
jgi:membrane associated rhomboid family serine protease